MPEAAPAATASTVAEAVRQLSRQFREAGVPGAEQDARLLVLAACGLSHEDYVLEPDAPLSPEAAARVAGSAARRLSREPVSRIIGRREFWGRSFALGPATLDPRPETELLVEAVLGILTEEGRREDRLTILDLGAGTGCILLTLLAELPRAIGIGVDIDTGALGVARHNAAALGLTARTLFCCGDWTASFSRSPDVIVTNPPYIRHSDIPGLEPEVALYDPHYALDGGPDGLEAYRQITAGTAEIAQPGTWLVMEAGAGQMPQIIGLLENSGWRASRSSRRVYTDLAGHERVVAVRKQE